MPLFTFILMGALTLASMVITCFIPETRNKVMAETVCEQTSAGTGSKQAKRRDSEIKPKESKICIDGHRGNDLDPASQKLPSLVGSFTDSTPLSADPNTNPETGVSNYGYTDKYETHRF